MMDENVFCGRLELDEELLQVMEKLDLAFGGSGSPSCLVLLRSRSLR